MTQSIINYAEHNIPADVGTLAVVWNSDTKEFFFTNTWGYDIYDCLNKSTATRWEYDFASEDLQKDVDLFTKKKGFTLINKVKYLVTYNDDKLYEKEYLLLLVNKMKGLL